MLVIMGFPSRFLKRDCISRLLNIIGDRRIYAEPADNEYVYFVW
jgi:hypothetical protein